MTDLYSGHGWRVTLEKAPLPNGSTKEDVVIQRADEVHIIALLDKDHIVIIREYRAFYGDYIWMLPSGKLDKEADILEGAQRELREETGYRAAKITPLWNLNNIERIQITNHVFLAEDLTKDPLPQDDDEFIEVHVCTLEEALKNVENSSRIHTPSAYALRRFMNS